MLGIVILAAVIGLTVGIAMVFPAPQHFDEGND